MERGLQKANHYNQLAEWVQRVEACRKSGQKVSEWCSEQGITVSTYYSWQRKVFQTEQQSQRRICPFLARYGTIGAREITRNRQQAAKKW